MPGREDLIQQNRSRAIAPQSQPTENPQPAPGVPRPDAPSTSSGEGKLFDGNVQPSRKKMLHIKEKLLRPAQTSHYQCWFNPPMMYWNGLHFINNLIIIQMQIRN